MSFITDALKNIAPGIASMLGGPLAGAAVSWLGKELLGDDKASMSDVMAAAINPDNAVKLKELDNQLKLAQLASEDADKDRQAEINKVEAASESFFKSGARPMALWLAVLGWGYNYIAVPIGHSFGVPMVGIPTDQISWLLGGLLGLGAFRTVEKIKGRA